MAKGGEIAAVILASAAVGGLAYVSRKKIAQAIQSPPGGFTPPGSGGPLAAAISADKTQGMAPLTVQFSANASGGQQPLQYRWGFGDGTVSQDPNPVHTFTEIGLYQVALSIVDAGGQQVTEFINISTNNLPPPPPPGQVQPISSVSNSGLSGDAPFTVGFELALTDPLASVLWNFGDPSPTSANPNTDTGLVVNHLYGRAGTYTVTLTVTSAKWGIQTKVFTVVVSTAANTPFAVNLYVSAANGPAPLNVDFSVALGAQQSSIVWDFGDGTKNTQNLMAISHVYQNPGTYNGSVTVTDIHGNIATKPFQITVGQNPLKTVTANFLDFPTQINPISGLAVAGTVIDFEGEGGGGSPPLAYSWDFGDGSTGSGITTSHTYAKPGTYTVVVTVRDSLGDVATQAKPITVDSMPIEVGDVSIVILSSVAEAGSGGTIQAMQVKVINNRSDVPIPGFIAVDTLSRTSGQAYGPEQDTSNFTLAPGGSNTLNLLSEAYVPGQTLITIRFFDFSATGKALAEKDLNV